MLDTDWLSGCDHVLTDDFSASKSNRESKTAYRGIPDLLDPSKLE